MKKCYCIILLLVILSIFLSCSYHNMYYEMAVCGTYSVPGVALRDLKGDSYKCREIATDSYGRLLYEFSAESVVTMKQVSALVILQKYDSTYVYFYEDNSYMYYSSENADIETFKEQNDWNKPMDDAKLSRRRCSVSFDSVINVFPEHYFVDIRVACEAALDGKVIARNIRYMDVVYLDADGSGHELYYLLIDNKHGTEAYFVIIDKNCKLSFMQILNETVNQYEFSAFKQISGWQYGYAQ